MSVIPPKLNPAVKDAMKISGQMIVNVKGAQLEYGDIIAMSGDMFEDLNDLLTMSQAQLEELAKLIKEEKTTGNALDRAAGTGRPVGDSRNWRKRTNDCKLED
jgi:hypothetical protein